MINKERFCYESLLSLSRPGGESLSLREDSIDPLRSGLYIEIDKGDSYISSLISGRVIGLIDGEDTSPVSDGCFQIGCTTSMGIWTYSSAATSGPTYNHGAFEEGCVSSDCLAPYKPVCKERLPYNHIGGFEDSQGRFRFRELTEEDCQPIEPIEPPAITTDPFTTSYKLLGSRLLSTYSTPDLDIYIEEATYFDGDCFDNSCFDKTYYVYARVKKETESCFDECSVDCLVLLAIYDSSLNNLSVSSDSLYNNENVIDDQFLSGNGLEEGILLSSSYNFLLNSPSLTEEVIRELSLLALDIHVYLSDLGVNPVQVLLGSYRRLPVEHRACDYLCNEYSITSPIGSIRYRANRGIIERWIEGFSNSSEYVYVVDIGHLHPLTYEPVIEESDVPIRAGGYFYSTRPIRQGVKIVILKRVYSDSSKSTLHHLFGYQYTEPLIRSLTKPLLLYNSIDQRVDLEDLSISLISLLLSKYPGIEECPFKRPMELDREILDLVESNLRTLSSLIDRFSSIGRRGSIPSDLTTYSSSPSIYNDARYLNRVVSPFEDLVIEEDCFSKWIDDTLSSRRVSNRAMSWYLYLLCIYKKVTSSTTYDEDIALVSSYLISQMNKRSSLVKEGWTHSDRYLDSVEIEVYTSSTSLMTCIALMKAHDLTLDYTSIEKATDLYESIYDYLYSLNEKVFFHSYEDPSISNDSLLYGLLFSHITHKSEVIEEILKLIKTRTRPLQSEQVGRVITTSSGIPIRNSRGGLLRTFNSESLSSSLITSPSSAIAIYPPNPYTSLTYVLKDMNLLEDVIELSGSKAYPIEFLPFLEIYRDRLDKEQVSNRYINTSLNLARCMSGSISTHPLFLPQSYWDIETLLFNRGLVLNRLRSFIPNNYSWPSEAATSSTGNMGRLLKAFSKSLSNWWVGIRRAKDGIYLSKATDTYIDKWALQFGIERRLRESDDSLRERIRNSIVKGNISMEEFISLLSFMGIEAQLTQPLIMGYGSYLESGIEASYSQASYSGSSTNPSTVFIESSSHISSNDMSTIDSYKPIGVNLLVRERLEFIDCLESYSKEDHYISISAAILPAQYSSFCCTSTYLPGRKYPIEIDLGTTYECVLYAYASLLEGKVRVEVSEVSGLEGLIGIIRPGQYKALFIIPTYFF
jgi:hypothetical protein